jgi:RNA polymerase sigma-70 factor (ECF subfamily)
MTTTDADLVRRSLEGAQSAFEALLDRYERPVYNAVYRIVGSREAAKDVTQTVFLKVFKRLARYDPEQPFGGWIYRIAVNESVTVAKRDGRFVQVEIERVCDHPDPEQALRQSELVDGVQAAIGRLAPDHRAVIVLKHLLGCSYREIGGVLELPEKTVKSRLFTARHQLKDALVNQGIQP